MRDDSLLLILVPELAQVTQERYNILHQISLLSPVGRHLLAVSTKLSESAVRTHLTIMAEQGLVEERPNGISPVSYTHLISSPGIYRWRKTGVKKLTVSKKYDNMSVSN